jgi:hypothetical protein
LRLLANPWFGDSVGYVEETFPQTALEMVTLDELVPNLLRKIDAVIDFLHP